MGNRAVLYARVSGDDRRKPGNNLAGQIEMGREYAREQGYIVVAELAEDDRGASGASWDLPMLNQALEMAGNGDFDVLVVRELDRFARNLAKQLVVENELKRKGVSVEYVLASYDATPEGQLQKHVRAVIAEYEKEKIAERTTRGRFSFVRKGNVLGHGKAPFGYKLVSTEGARTLEIYEPEAKTIRLIFSMYTEQGMSIRGIARELSKMGIPTAHDMRGGYKLNGRGVWNPGSLQRILNSETYAGVWHYGKRRYKDGKFVENGREHRVAVRVPAIISRETWKTAQKRREQNRRAAKHRQKYHYLLSGRVRCGNCGLAMAGRTVVHGEKLYQYYYCPAVTDHSPRDCNRPYFAAAQADPAVWRWLSEWLCDEEQLARGLEAFRTEQELANSPSHERLDTIDGLLADQRSQLERLIDLYLTGQFSQELLAERKARLEETIDSLEMERHKLAASIEDTKLTARQIKTVTEFGARIRKGLAVAEASFDDKRQLIEALDLEVVLSTEDDEKVAYVTCRLGEERLSVANTSR